jgi:hypothetical protein
VLQGNLKKLTKTNLKKLKSRILQAGFCAPIFIWSTGKKNKILDGTQRRAALLSLQEDGYLIPKIPVVYIDAESEEKAKEILLSISSQYGEWNEDELSKWLDGIDDEINDQLRLVDEDVKRVLFDPNENPEQSNKDVSQDDIDKGKKKLSTKIVKSTRKIAVVCPECAHQFEVSA